MRRAKATLVAGLMRKESFDGVPLEDAMAEYVISPTARMRMTSVHCRHAARLVAPQLLELRYTTRLDGLRGPFGVRHTYAFPLHDEVRHTAAVLRPDRPEWSSTVLIGITDGRRGYVNVCVADDEEYLIRSTVLAYDSAGNVHPYVPVVPNKFTSPLQLGKASLDERRDARGRRVLRLSLEIQGLTEPTTVKVGYSALGVHEVRHFNASPEQPLVESDLLLDDNPELLPGEWVIGATDVQNRMLVNGIVRLSAVQPVDLAEAGWPRHTAAEPASRSGGDS